MSLTVNTNLGALVAQRSLFNATLGQNTAMQRLSTGLRVNTASDDSAGLSLSEKIKSQVSSAEMCKSNAQTAINLVQTAESDLAVIQDNLQRMRDLSVQASNGVYSSAERKMINNEFAARSTEIDRIASSSSFSDRKLLDGSFTQMAVQIGTNNSANDRINLTTTTFKDFNFGQNGIPAASVGISTVGNAQAAIALMDIAISSVSNSRAGMGAVINRLQGAITQIDTRKENMASSLSVIRDADIAKESAALTKGNILKQAATSMLQQANQTPQLALNLLR